MKITSTPFGQLQDGSKVDLFTLKNDTIAINITNYGAIITAIDMPNKNGSIENVVCGFNKLETYLSEEYLGSYPYFGAIIGFTRSIIIFVIVTKGNFPPVISVKVFSRLKNSELDCAMISAFPLI